MLNEYVAFIFPYSFFRFPFIDHYHLKLKIWIFFCHSETVYGKKCGKYFCTNCSQVLHCAQIKWFYIQNMSISWIFLK